MRFLFVASGATVPSTRFRVFPYLPLLRQAGHRCDVACSFPQKYDYFKPIGWRASQLLKRTTRHWHALLARMRHYDAIVIEREVFDDDSWNIEAKLRRCTGRLVLDVDDGIHLLHPEKFAAVARMCDAAIGGNRYLEDVLRPLCREVYGIPTCVRLSEYPLRTPPPAGTKPTVGWIGTTHNVEFLSVCAAALRQVAAEIPFRLLVIAPSPEHLANLDLAGVDVEYRVWDPDTEVSALHEMDIGLMPLPAGQPWMKYKCGLKLIQYLAVGTPGIASPIGVNDEILAGNAVGRRATTDAEWRDALTELLADTETRMALGQAGRELVARSYSIEANWSRLEAILCGHSADGTAGLRRDDGDSPSHS